MSTATATREGWVVTVGGKVKGPVHTSRNAGREYARGKKLTGFKVVRESEAPTATATTTKPRKSTGEGYVPAVRRKCADCGHYRKRDDQVLVPREVTFERGGKTITQTREVAVCKGGCRDNVR